MNYNKFPEQFHIDPVLFYNAIVRSTNDYIYIVDMVTDRSLVSENMERDFELPGRIVDGLIPLWGDLIHEKDRPRFYDSIEQMLSGQTDEHNVEYQVRNRKNEYIWVVCRGLLQRDENGTPVFFAGVVNNLSNSGKVDYVTGLFKQRECEHAVNKILEDHEGSSGILLLGLDDFSRINNLNTHSFGDSVLRQFAQDVQRLLPPQANIYRFDGDEFAIVFKGATHRELKDLYKQIKTYSNREHEIDGTTYYCSVSAGIAMIGSDSTDFATLVKYAATALESAKNSGKNACSFFMPGSILPKLRNFEISSQLQTCVLNNMAEFYLVYQPFSYSESMEVIGAEALLRWRSKTFGEVFPSEFIPLLESTGLIVPVGKWILEQAIQTCKKWTALCPEFVINVNVSYLQFLDDTFVSFVTDTLKENDLDASHIVLELTESYFVTDMELLKKSFCQLRDANIRIAMDDFGTGYSSLGMLSQSPADIVKIDRVFISKISDQAHAFNRSFIAAVIKLCHSVGISVCVEGVEHREELETVCAAGADCIQGFYISKPIPPEEFSVKYLQEKKPV